MKKIKLSGKTGKGKYALIDDEDFEYLNQWKWHLSSNGYPTRGEWNKKRKQNKLKRLHRELLNPPKNRSIDHINGNTLDNRKSNLRICKHRENLRNQKKQRNRTSKYKGVSFYKNYERWEAYICTHKKKHRLGYFDNELEAAKAYNQAALDHFGKYARLNNI